MGSPVQGTVQQSMFPPVLLRRPLPSWLVLHLGACAFVGQLKFGTGAAKEIGVQISKVVSQRKMLLTSTHICKC